MGHRNYQDTEFYNDLSLVWSWCTEGINPGFVGSCQWTGFSLNQYFASGALNSLWIFCFQNCSWRFYGITSLLHHSPSVNAVRGQKEPGIKDGGGKGYISWVLGVPDWLQCPQEAAWSLSVRQPQPVLSLGSAQRHQATASSKSGMEILWIQAGLLPRLEKPHLFDSEARGTTNLYRHFVQTVVDTQIVHGTLGLLRHHSREELLNMGIKLFLLLQHQDFIKPNMQQNPCAHSGDLLVADFANRHRVLGRGQWPSSVMARQGAGNGPAWDSSALSPLQVSSAVCFIVSHGTAGSDQKFIPLRDQNHLREDAVGIRGLSVHGGDTSSGMPRFLWVFGLTGLRHLQREQKCKGSLQKAALTTYGLVKPGFARPLGSWAWLGTMCSLRSCAGGERCYREQQSEGAGRVKCCKLESGHRVTLSISTLAKVAMVF